MHLYLSSFLIGDKGHNLAQLARGKTALVVSNALDCSLWRCLQASQTG